MTKVSNNAEKWLKDNLDIDVNDIEDAVPNLENQYKATEESKITYINDNINIHVKKPKSLNDLNLDKTHLDSLLTHKAIIVAELKKADRRNSIFLRKKDIIEAILRVDIGLNSSQLNQILEIYSTSDVVEYIKFMNLLIKDIQRILGNITQSTQELRPKSAITSLKSNNLRNTLLDKKVELDEVVNELKTIKIVFEKIKNNRRTALDQNISINEFSNILRDLNIVFPKNKLIKILLYLDLNPDSFSIKTFSENLKACKVLASEMSSSEIIDYFHKVRDIVYTNGGQGFLFDKDRLSREEFIAKLLEKCKYNAEILGAVFHYLTKTDRDLTIQDYVKYFIDGKKNELNEEFEINVIRTINNKISKAGLRQDEYFDHLLSYKNNRSDNRLNRIEFHKAMNIEKFNYSAEELDFIFNFLDKKNDQMLDRDEFKQNLNKVSKALFHIQDIIKSNGLEIEDLIHRMNINKDERLDFFKFKSSIFF